MADLKPAYLIHGEDEVKLDAWRARIRDRAEREEASLELMDAARDAGEAVAVALSSMTLSMGTRYVVVDGMERWKDKDVAAGRRLLATPAARDGGGPARNGAQGARRGRRGPCRRSS